ncbi:hypothetical protein J4437_04135 [Candidatus Woesearchaeota archaeon]|nr:hypothetical protein [uncultured archaeon]MBS3123799.1 hypothetical protein [Candidatus Woesearchaeota archaeon]
MHKHWELLERYNSKLVPYAVVLLLVLIFIELFIHPQNKAAVIAIEVFDLLVLMVFVIDLVFLALKAKTTAFFFKHYWLDLLVLFPFSLFFALVARLARTAFFAESFLMGQTLAHEGIEVRKGVSAFARTGRLAKLSRIAARGFRFILHTDIFSRFHQKHHHARKKVFKLKNLQFKRL